MHDNPLAFLYFLTLPVGATTPYNNKSENHEALQYHNSELVACSDVEVVVAT